MINFYVSNNYNVRIEWKIEEQNAIKYLSIP